MMKEISRRKFQIEGAEVEEFVERLDNSQMTAFDERVQGYWLERTYAAYGDRPTKTEMFCFWSKAEVQRAVNNLLNNILTLRLKLFNESKTWHCVYVVRWTSDSLVLREEVLKLMSDNGVRQRSIKNNDAPRIGQEAIHAATFNRKLIKAIKALEQDNGAIQFKVDTTNYELSRGANGGLILKRNGKLFDVFEKKRGGKFV